MTHCSEQKGVLFQDMISCFARRSPKRFDHYPSSLPAAELPCLQCISCLHLAWLHVTTPTPLFHSFRPILPKHSHAKETNWLVHHTG